MLYLKERRYPIAVPMEKPMRRARRFSLASHGRGDRISPLLVFQPFLPVLTVCKISSILNCFALLCALHEDKLKLNAFKD